MVVTVFWINRNLIELITELDKISFYNYMM